MSMEEEKDFYAHLVAAVASYRRMNGAPITPDDLDEVIDAVYARREERGWACPPRESLAELVKSLAHERMTAARQTRYEPIDDIDRARESALKESWYDCRDGTGRHDSRGHKIQSFMVPRGEITTLCGRNVVCAFPTRTTSDPFEAEPHRGVRIKCRRCEAEVLSGRWVYP